MSGAPKVATGSAKAKIAHRMPEDIENNKEIDAACAPLPSNYNFEIKKSIWKIRAANAKYVALQFPEGLLLFSCTIADIITRFTGAECVILGDVTYGACCIDDFSARALGCDFLVHYGHSCLVPIDQMSTGINVLYVFVGIEFDISHLVACIRANFPRTTRLALLGTIQFATALHKVRQELADDYEYLHVPQAKPLSPGEVLGCTSPTLVFPDGQKCDSLIFVADGRFHLEATMISNPDVAAFRYDPYGKVMTQEYYDTPRMHDMRQGAIAQAKQAIAVGRAVGLILGTLGRQGSTKILKRLEEKLAKAGIPYFVMLLSEISAAKLSRFSGLPEAHNMATAVAGTHDNGSPLDPMTPPAEDDSSSNAVSVQMRHPMTQAIGAWIQIACPRLSIDWGTGFENAPLLNPYEAEVAIGTTEWRTVYPMDFYARGSGSWTNYYKPEDEGDAGAKKSALRERLRLAAAKRAAAAQEASASQDGVDASSVDEKKTCCGQRSDCKDGSIVENSDANTIANSGCCGGSNGCSQ